MKRRTFLKGAAVTAATSAALAACGGEGSSEKGQAPAIVKKRRQLKMVTCWPKLYPGSGVSAENVAQHVRDATEGAIDIKVFAAGELVPAFEAMDAVSNGVADIYHGTDYYWQGKHRALNFFTGIPLGLTAAEANAWLYFGGGQELWDELSARFNVKALPVNNTGTQMGGWFKKEINSLEDLKGLKMRITGLAGEVYRRLGAATVTLPGGDIFLALQQGTIDATEWVGPWTDLALGLQRITKYYYFPCFQEPGSVGSLGFNLDLWNNFSLAEKTVFRTIAAEENVRSHAEYTIRNGEALEVLVQEHGVELKRFNDDILDAFVRISKEVVEEIATADDLSQRIYESWNRVRTHAMAYSTVADAAFLELRRRALGSR